MASKYLRWYVAAAFIIPPAVSQAIDGTIEYKAYLTADTCQISAYHQFPSANFKYLIVPLPDVTTADISAGSTSFSIQIFCSGGRVTKFVDLDNVRMRFISDAVNERGVLLNTATNGAENIGIHLATKAGVPVNVNGPAEPGSGVPYYTSVSSLSNPYVATYQKLHAAQAITPGRFEAAVHYEVSYF